MRCVSIKHLRYRLDLGMLGTEKTKRTNKRTTTIMNEFSHSIEVAGRGPRKRRRRHSQQPFPSEHRTNVQPPLPSPIIALAIASKTMVKRFRSDRCYHRPAPASQPASQPVKVNTIQWCCGSMVRCSSSIYRRRRRHVNRYRVSEKPKKKKNFFFHFFEEEEKNEKKLSK